MALVLPVAGQNFIKLNELGMTSIPVGSPYLTAYEDLDHKQWDVGWGHLLSYKPSNLTITPAQAQAYFNSDTQSALTTMASTISPAQLAKLGPQQITACVDTIYRAGPGTWGASGIPQAINSGNIAQAATLMQNLGCAQEGNRSHADAILLLGKGHINPTTGAYVG